MALTNLNKLFVRVTDASLRNAVITKSETDNKIYFLTTTHEIITHGAAYGLSTNVQDEITKIKSILNTYYTDGTEDSVKVAIDAVQTALNDYKTENDAKRAVLIKTVKYNAAEKTIDFTQENNEVQHINVSDIIGNHIVRSSSYDASTNILKLTFGGASEDVVVDIDLGQMLDMNDVISGDAEHFAVSYDDKKKLTIMPVISKVESDTVGLADAKDVKSYVDDAVSGAQDTLQASIETINGKLDIIQGEENVDGSINKALKDAKEYANDLNSTATAAITKEVSDRKAADQALYGAEIPADDASTISGNAANIVKLTDALAAEKTNREAADNAEKSAREADIKEITDALADPATFWEDYTA